jgi:hypothetical protein
MYHNLDGGASDASDGRVRSTMGVERGSHSRDLPVLDERDLCPICGRHLPPRGSDGSEEAREAHVRECVQASSPTPTAVMRMLVFGATEKDCVNADGTAQECTICMEEYEEGAALVRLECLCKFHRTCIEQWFAHKKECPVHKVG